VSGSPERGEYTTFEAPRVYRREWGLDISKAAPRYVYSVKLILITEIVLMLRMYKEFSKWYPLHSPVEEHAEEAAFFWQPLAGADLPDSPTLLELGCGAGGAVYHMKKHFSHMTLTDLSPHMLAVCKINNPECEHLVGDMRTIRLEKFFDVVFVQDTIGYMTTLSDLKKVMETAYIHCKPGGAVLLAPDYVQEIFEPSTIHFGGDEGDRSIRVLEWAYKPDDNPTGHITEYIYAFREGNQPIQVEYDTHVYGLFPRKEWFRLLKESAYPIGSARDRS
jgi:SAM-dependent methyltransferase